MDKTDVRAPVDDQEAQSAETPDEKVGVHPVWAEIDLDALVGNYRALLERLRPEVKVIVSIKANAYGHGAIAVARALEAEGVYGLATGSLRDALAIRQAGVNSKIVVFATHLPEAAAEVARRGFIPTIYNLQAARSVSSSVSSPARIYVKVDCGLGRLGVPVDEAEALVKSVSELPRVVVEGVYTHLPFVNRRGLEWARRRLRVFEELLLRLARSGVAIPIRQALSSAGVLAGLNDAACNAVAPGHLLYGIQVVEPDVADFSDFRPVMRALKAKLIHVVTTDACRSVGLGGESFQKAGAVTGIVPIGMADGYSGVKSAAAMLLRGQRVPVTGVSLEHTALDLTKIDQPAIGEEVTIVGSSGTGYISLDEMAASQNMSVLRALTAISGRVPYVLIRSGETAVRRRDLDTAERRARSLGANY